MVLLAEHIQTVIMSPIYGFGLGFVAWIVSSSYLQHFKMFPFKTLYFFQSSTSHMTQFRVNNKSTEVCNQAFNI